MNNENGSQNTNGVNNFSNNYMDQNQNLKISNNVDHLSNGNFPNTNMNNIQNQNNSNFNINNNNESEGKKISTKNIVFLILSILNMVTIFPLVISFCVIWLIFGALGDRSTYYSVFGGCGIYGILSILILLKSIWDVVKYNRVLKIVFGISVLVFAVSIVESIVRVLRLI